MSKKHNPDEMKLSLLDESIPLEHRMQLIVHMCMADTAEARAVVKAILESAAKANGEQLYHQKLQQLVLLLEEMQEGPLRSAMFIRMVKPRAETSVPRAEVRLRDGEVAYPAVPDEAVASSLRCGDAVLLEAHGKAIVGRDPDSLAVGEEVRFERRIDRHRIEVSVHDHETDVFNVSASLAERLDAEEVKPGARLLAGTRQMMALEAVPSSDRLADFWFLVREPVPDVVVDRDIGCPPAYIEEYADHVRMWMTRPDLGRRYGVRQAASKLLAGTSGAGKTLSIFGLWRRMYEVMSEVTGLAIDELPPRVFRLRVSEIFIKWFGDSEKRLDRFFDEVEQVADQTIRGADGVEYHAPVLAICEEIDALARARGTGEPISERIQTTALERMDINSPRLRDRLIIVLSTTNVPQLVDAAFARRAGASMTWFGRLSRSAFTSVLSKHLRGRRFHDDYGDQAEAERQALQEVTGWLFSRNGHDHGQVEISYVGTAAPEVRYRRDVLTGALVNRAVNEASGEACRAEYHGQEGPGLTGAMLVSAFERQIQSIVQQLTPHNIANYVTIPDGARVANVRRLEQPSVSPLDLMRVS